MPSNDVWASVRSARKTSRVFGGGAIPGPLLTVISHVPTKRLSTSEGGIGPESKRSPPATARAMARARAATRRFFWDGRRMAAAPLDRVDPGPGTLPGPGSYYYA